MAQVQAMTCLLFNVSESSVMNRYLQIFNILTVDVQLHDTKILVLMYWVVFVNAFDFFEQKYIVEKKLTAEIDLAQHTQRERERAGLLEVSRD